MIEQYVVSLDQHVTHVDQGVVIQDFTCPSSGWIWYDEAGLLGYEKVYESHSEAMDAIKLYAKSLG